MSKPRLLDLFCGAGGASMGYHRAGFEVVGVDIKPQPHYPFSFIQEDALTVLRRVLSGVDKPNAIAASPPCQAYSKLRVLHKNNHPELIEPTRKLLLESGLPYIMENVEGAPMPNAITLCGSMFDLNVDEYELRRHRLFESNCMLLQPHCQHDKIAIGVFGHGSNKSRKNKDGKWRGLQADKRQAAAVMDIDWMTRDELSQAIPPAYTEYLGRQLMEFIK